MSTPGTATVRSQEVPEFPRSAASYALKELARRAGVSAEMYRTWRMETDATGCVNVFVDPGTDKRIRFPQSRPEFWRGIREGVFRTSQASWMRAPDKLLELVPDFHVPFSSIDRDNVGCLFSIANESCVDCPVDLLAATVLTLGRFEEILPSPKDEHGRFCARSSIAWRDGFLHRPVVDEFGLGLEQALLHLLPQWKPQERRLRVKVSHDVDEIGLPFSFRGAVGHAVRRGRPLWAVRDLLARPLHLETTYQGLLRRIVGLSIERGIKPAVYWKASDPGPNDTGYDPRHRAIRPMIDEFRKDGVEMGIHPGYRTFQSRERLSAEVSTLQEFLGERLLGGRQDYLRWNPQMWIEWESLGLAYDSSVGFTDQLGFRAGTCYPFHPWIFSESREANILEIPILAMDDAVKTHEELEPGAALPKIREIVERCRLVGGVFTLIWHNITIIDPGFRQVYQTLLDELAGNEGYNWKTDHGGSTDAS
jgi:hypothetical protein